jgi:hypothetical protein
MRRSLLATLLALATPVFANELDMSKVGAPPTDSWPTYQGDYT